MEVVVVIVVLGALAAGAVALSRRRSADAERRAVLERGALQSPLDEQRMLTGDVRRLAPGDVVHHDGTDFLVDRTVEFDEDGFRWHEHLLLDAIGGRRLWLSVEDDEGVEVAVWEKLGGLDLDPTAPEVVHEGVTYRREERGRARFVVREAAGERERGEMEYADFVAGDKRLGFERYGTGGWETSLGTVVPEAALDVYPKGA
ncbi:DUF4178 domain-containing protein [Conexibacter sp. SYSU D00693]|uniref:DUF4178 domain-containing protein n=1 Tax=Conexibacter sp. SYSU D00693 TaxID=2812560 RepID=UPI00196B6D66|nr:DUF4178 domain-containing protein [Conexibacter sp. SYSU D00693]